MTTPDYQRGRCTKRLVQTMLAISSRPYTVWELSEKFGVCYKTSMRDIHAIEAMEIPVHEQIIDSENSRNGYHRAFSIEQNFLERFNVTIKAKESSLWSWLKQAEASYGNSLHCYRVENSVEKGTPDVHGCIGGRPFTIELKAVARTKSIDCHLSEFQIWFAHRSMQAGGNHWILIQVGFGNDAKRYLINGSQAPLLKTPIAEEYLQKWSEYGTKNLDPIGVFSIIRDAGQPR